MRKKTLQRDLEIEEASINLTPLIDIVMVVLIIFIIIAPMLELDRVNLAQASTGPEKIIALTPEKGEIGIHVHADNTIWLNGKKVAISELTSLLKEIHKKQPQRTPQLFHDKNAFFGTYQSVKNAVEMAGFEQIDVILKPS
jgi:biopolymer transport protein ExbD